MHVALPDARAQQGWHRHKKSMEPSLHPAGFPAQGRRQMPRALECMNGAWAQAWLSHMPSQVKRVACPGLHINQLRLVHGCTHPETDSHPSVQRGRPSPSVTYTSQRLPSPLWSALQSRITICLRATAPVPSLPTHPPCPPAPQAATPELIVLRRHSPQTAARVLFLTSQPVPLTAV